ncbi:MAG TPA: hypothetical protein VFI33_10900 [Puia sp.]|nr:hypothetical protein [Puia sp.]
MIKGISILLLVVTLISPACIFCQSVQAPQAPQPSPYPKIVTYMCFFLPVVSTSSKTTTWNFSGTFSLGVATGINILYSDRFGFSFDLGPVITTTKGLSKVSNFIFDPGPIFRLKKGLFYYYEDSF